MFSCRFVPLIELLNTFCFRIKRKKYSFKFDHCSVILMTTYFIVSHRTEECRNTYWAASSVSSCNLVWSSRLALDSLKKLFKFTANWSISKGSLEMPFLKDVWTLCSVQVSMSKNVFFQFSSNFPFMSSWNLWSH